MSLSLYQGLNLLLTSAGNSFIIFRPHFPTTVNRPGFDKVVAMAFMAIVLLRRYPTTEQRAMGAIALVAPGMLLDTISAVWFPAIFPNIRTACSGLFGGWLLFCNVVVLLTAVLYRPTAA